METIFLPSIGFNCFYGTDSFLEHCEVRWTDRHSISFYPKQGDPWAVTVPKNVVVDVYVHQYGIPVSEKYNCFFVPQWGVRGLYCLDLHTGELRWNIRIKNATELFLDNDYIICSFRYTCLAKIRISDGEIVARRSASSEICGICSVWPKHILLGPLRDRYFLLDYDLQTLASFMEKQIIPDLHNQSDPDEYSFFLDHAWLFDDTLHISGTEHAYIPVKEQECVRFGVPVDFERAKYHFYRELPLKQ